MVNGPKILNARVMHQRFFPKQNGFTYGVYYLGLALPATLSSGKIISFYPKDLGYRDGSDPGIWAREILASYGLNEKVTDIFLLTMPRVMGYVFNPVSFYLCRNLKSDLVAVICEVHNTFGEQHIYICAEPDHAPIHPDTCLIAEKVFHVSPFIKRDGYYKFRFQANDEKMAIWIDYYNDNGKRQLATSLIGNFAPLNAVTLRQAFWRHPLVSLKAMVLIHWQALKIITKSIRYISKPLQKNQKITATQNLKKM